MKNLLNRIAQSKNTELINRTMEILDNVHDEQTKLQMLEDILSFKHICEEDAENKVSKMYYILGGQKVHGPFVVKGIAYSMFERIKCDIPLYSALDFWAALNYTISNHHNLFYSWWKNEEDDEMMRRYVEVTINWLKDDDYPVGRNKVVDLFV